MSIPSSQSTRVKIRANWYDPLDNRWIYATVLKEHTVVPGTTLVEIDGSPVYVPDTMILQEE